MIKRDDYGFLTNPTNGLGIVRARTLIGNLRSWDIPRSEEALDTVVDEIGTSPIPGLYMLFDERNDKRVYIGQTENIKSRLATHMKSPDPKIRHWERAIIISDGRNASQSDLNDENLRLILENYLVSLFKINKYQVTTASSRMPTLSATQKTLSDSFKEELIVLLTNKNKINKVLIGRGDDEVYNDEVKKILVKKGHTVQKWGKVEAIVDNARIFIRAGSRKSAGWQVTFRGAKSDSFKSRLADGDGYLLVPRGSILLIPLKQLKDFVSTIDSDAFKRDTIDVFVRFDEDKIVVFYKGKELEVTKFTVQPFPAQ
jgi:hypothetical protein